MLAPPGGRRRGRSRTALMHIVKEDRELVSATVEEAKDRIG